LFVFLLFSGYCWSQQFKAARALPLNFENGGTIVDMNSDGKPDLVSVDQDGHSGTTLTIAFGNGDGTFGTPIVSNLGILGPSGTLSLFAAVADVNGDGNPDVILQAFSATHLIFVNLSNGDGTFQTPSSLSTPTLYSAFVASDLTGDGKVDIAAVNFNDFASVLSLFKGNGDGTFQAPINTPLSGEPTGLLLGDFNNDGKPDLAVSDSSQHLTIFVNNGTGVFTPKGPFLTGSGSNTAPFEMSLAAADLNGDGKLDIVLTDALDGKVSVLLGHGDGTFGGFTQIPAGTNVSSIAIADLNEDGKPDLIVQNQDAMDLGVLIGNGDGTFQPLAGYAVAGDISIGPLFVADFNQDGHADAATLQAIVLGAGDGAFPLTAKAVSVGAGAAAIAAGDFNGDGILDFVTSNAGGSNGTAPIPATITVGLGKGDGTFSVTTIATGIGGSGIAVGDFNKDGKLDIVLANTPANVVSLFLGNGDGTFQPEVDFAVDPNPNNISIADVNNDGNLDLLVTHGTFAVHGGIASSSRIAVLLGKGDGTFQPAQFATGPNNVLPVALAVADYNGDGNLDFIVGDALSGAQTPYFGTGTGAFSSAPFVGDNATFWIASGDFNGDGKPDAVASDAACVTSPVFVSCIRTFLNNGFGSGFLIKDTQTPRTAQFIATGDLDGDGVLDVVYSNAFNIISTMKGNGDGTFQPGVDYVSGEGTTHLVVADLNNDGAPDILAVAQLNPAVFTLLNTGHAPVTFPPGYDFSTALTSANVIAGQSVVVSTAITGFGGFSSQVSFSCIGLPPLAGCNFSPATLTPSSTPSPVTVTITTTGTGTGTGQVASLTTPGDGKRLAFAGVILVGFVAMVFGLLDNARGRIAAQTLGSCLIVGVLFLSGCGGGGAISGPGFVPTPTPSPTPVPATAAGTYLVQVQATATTATGKTVVHLIPLRLTVR
jgi:hypothetical protein